jgi:hypothetical protein
LAPTFVGIDEDEEEDEHDDEEEDDDEERDDGVGYDWLLLYAVDWKWLVSGASFSLVNFVLLEGKWDDVLVVGVFLGTTVEADIGSELEVALLSFLTLTKLGVFKLSEVNSITIQFLLSQSYIEKNVFFFFLFKLLKENVTIYKGNKVFY